MHLLFKRIALIFTVFFSISVQAIDISDQQSSSYIKLHVNDAVKWQQWDKSILQRAQEENKLIFISSGYYSCHWCHVMRNESFIDHAVAKIINTQYIPVKIDREEEVSLDAYLMDFMQLTQGYGGWPLNVFISPDGYPVTGFVYQPKDKFIDILTLLNQEWRNNPQKIKLLSTSTFKQIKNINNQNIILDEKQLIDEFRTQAKKQADTLEGGFGEQSKFPEIELLRTLMRISKKFNDKEIAEFIELTLNQMVDNGLHDMVSGGFFRYTEDQGWTQPHFEKMLYTNAAMINLYVDAYKMQANPRWLSIAEETVMFVVRNMKHSEGGYISSISAQDAQGKEGGYYTWDKSELDAIFNPQELKKLQQFSSLIVIEENNELLPSGFSHDKAFLPLIKRLREKVATRKFVKDTNRVLSWNAYFLSAIQALNEVADQRYKDIEKSQYQYVKAAAHNVLKNKEDLNISLNDIIFTADALAKYSQNNKLTEALIKEALSAYLTADGWKESNREILPRPGWKINLPDEDLPAVDVILNQLIKRKQLEKLFGHYIDAVEWHKKKVDYRVAVQTLNYASYIGWLLELQQIPKKSPEE